MVCVIIYYHPHSLLYGTTTLPFRHIFHGPNYQCISTSFRLLLDFSMYYLVISICQKLLGATLPVMQDYQITIVDIHVFPIFLSYQDTFQDIFDNAKAIYVYPDNTSFVFCVNCYCCVLCSECFYCVSGSNVM